MGKIMAWSGHGKIELGITIQWVISTKMQKFHWTTTIDCRIIVKLFLLFPPPNNILPSLQTPHVGFSTTSSLWYTTTMYTYYTAVYLRVCCHRLLYHVASSVLGNLWARPRILLTSPSESKKRRLAFSKKECYNCCVHHYLFTKFTNILYIYF